MILIVDDSVDSRLLIRSLLEGEGHADIRMAASANEAFSQLGMNGQEAPPPPVDLVIMDVLMPVMGGLEACRRIGAVDRLKDVPVIVVTADNGVETLKAAFAAGAVDYLAKPLNPVELAARVRSALRLKRETDRRKEREADLLRMAKELEDANRRLQLLSSLDGLTGISNRRSFDEFLEQEWRRALRDGIPISLVMIDIDYFKPYNDRYGHLAGDGCLRRVAGALRDILRRPGDLAARYGGEEFAAVLSGTSADGARHVAEAVRRGVEDLNLPHAGSAVADHVTVSVGLATLVPRPGSLPQEVVIAADQALYRAKQQGRNRLCL
jgi:diguanylate cyclase (GGDEF)-like protein